jgi:hypothetical protein
LTVIDISNPYAPAVAASLQDATRFSGGTNLRLGADGQTAYFTTLTRASLATVDLSNPLAPAFLAEQRGPTPGSSMNGARDVILSRDGRYAFVTCDTANCVAVIDVSDRTAINWVTSITHAAMGSARGIALSADGNTLYVLAGGSAAQGFNGALLLIDVSNPTSPAIISVFAGYGGFGAVTYFAGGRGIVLYQNLAFITSETGAGLIVLDVSNPQQIRFLGGTKGPVPGTSLNGAMGIDITNGIASIACFTGAFVTAKAVWPSP